MIISHLPSGVMTSNVAARGHITTPLEAYVTESKTAHA